MKNSLLLTAAISVLLTACGGNKEASQSGESGTSSAQSAQSISIPDGIKLVDEVRAGEADIIIPFRKYELANGLTVILHEDKSDPIAHVDVTYHVGSGREEPGKSGFAHFFEHMLFQGSNNVADEEHFKMVTESGGTLNGTTNSDRTNYFQTVPSNQLEKMLWLESDRMGYFLDAVTQEKFEVQRDTVKNERGQRVDNAPYGRLWEALGEAMYPEGHPYSWSTIGYLEDLDRADLNDLKKFFLEWYGPNNATLTIGGDFDEEQVLNWVNQYFGKIQAGPEIEDPVYVPVTLDEDRYISMEDNVALPLVYMAWPTVHANHPDEAALDVLQDIVGGGRTSLIYKNMVKNGKAVQASAGHGCREIGCTFTMLALPTPGNTLTDLEKIARDSLVEFEGRGVLDDDLERTKAQIVSGIIYGLESVSGKVSQLAAFQTYRDDPDQIQHEINRYQNVTKADVMRVYNQYIKDKPAVILSIVPDGKPDAIAAPDTWTMYERTIPESAKVTELAIREPAPDAEGFDRSKVPPSGANPIVKVPPIYRATLGNGIKVLGAVNDETPTTTISIRIQTGQRNDPMDKLGLSSMAANMLNEATTESTNEELSNRLAKLGSSVSISSGDDYSTLYIRTLTDNLDETMAIAMERLYKPKFDEADFKRAKTQVLQSIETQKKEPSNTASLVYRTMLYGANNAISYNGSGTTQTASAITLDDVREYYNTYYKPNLASVVAVSNLDEGALSKALSGLEDWSGEAPAPQALKPFPDTGKTTLYFVDKKDAAQSQIRIGKRALPYDATGEFYRAGLMNYVLGGAFNSRINLNLREDKGYTYGARSGFNGNEEVGRYTASAGVRADSTAASIVEFVNEITGYAESGITPAELEFTKSAIGQRDARAYETPRQKLGFLGEILRYDLDESFVDEQNDILQSITKAEIDALAKKHLVLDDMIMVIVGDKATLMDDIKALGYPVVELDENGNRL